MSEQRSDKAKRRDQSRGPRVKPAEAEWGRKAAKAAQIAFDEDEFDDMLEGEDDAERELEIDAQERALAAECDPIAQRLVALVGTRSSPKLSPGLIDRERVEITGLAAEIRDDLTMLEPKKAATKLAELETLLQDAAEMEAKRAEMISDVAEQTRLVEAAKDLTPEERKEILRLRQVAVASIARDGGWDWEVMADVVLLEKAVAEALAAAAKRAEPPSSGAVGRDPAPSQPEPSQPPGIVVGTAGLSTVIQLSMSSTLSAAWKEADIVLKRLQAAGTVFPNVAAIIDTVAKDPAVAPKLAEAALARQQREARAAEDAKRKLEAEAARSKSPVVWEFAGRRDPIKVTQYDIVQGQWRQLTQEKRSGKRPETDWELVVTIGSDEIAFHLHGPPYPKGSPTAGEVMLNGRMTNTQTTGDVISAILSAHPRPGSWDKTSWDK
jgi:hypothetical protein